jgi:hypothetical protein
VQELARESSAVRDARLDDEHVIAALRQRRGRANSRQTAAGNHDLDGTRERDAISQIAGRGQHRDSWYGAIPHGCEGLRRGNVRACPTTPDPSWPSCAPARLPR